MHALRNDIDDGFAFPDRRSTPRRSLTDTQRLWISDRQWQSMLDATRGGALADPLGGVTEAGGLSDATGERQHPRVAADAMFRCVVRLHVDHAEDAPAAGGTYAVGIRNIGTGGLNFVHHAAVPSETRATLLMKMEGGAGEILGAKVIWCNLMQQEAEERRTFHVGLEFDVPLKAESPFL